MLARLGFVDDGPGQGSARQSVKKTKAVVAPPKVPHTAPTISLMALVSGEAVASSSVSQHARSKSGAEQCATLKVKSKATNEYSKQKRGPGLVALQRLDIF